MMSLGPMQYNRPPNGDGSPTISNVNHMNSQLPVGMGIVQPQPLHSSNSSQSSPQAPSASLPKITPEYLQELLKDKRNLQSFPNLFNHLDKILEIEIGRVRSQLFHFNGTKKCIDELPEGDGPIVTVQEKVYIPVKDNPTYNFVGRLLGPRGMTAKQLETDLDCKIMVRGKGSMRDKKKEDQNRGKPNWEHLSEDLHVLICVEDHQNRAELKSKRAAEEIKAFLDQAVHMPDSEDKLKQMQLMEVAMLNEANKAPSLLPNAQTALSLPQFFRLPPHPTAGSPLVLAPGGGPRPLHGLGGLGGPHLPHGLAPGHGAHLLSPSDPAAQLLNYPMVSGPDYSYLFSSGFIPATDPAAVAAAAAAAAAAYPTGGLELSQSGPMKARQGGSLSLRNHPYSRPTV